MPSGHCIYCAPSRFPGCFTRAWRTVNSAKARRRPLSSETRRKEGDKWVLLGPYPLRISQRRLPNLIWQRVPELLHEAAAQFHQFHHGPLRGAAHTEVLRGGGGDRGPVFCPGYSLHIPRRRKGPQLRSPRHFPVRTVGGNSASGSELHGGNASACGRKLGPLAKQGSGRGPQAGAPRASGGLPPRWGRWA